MYIFHHYPKYSRRGGSKCNKDPYQAGDKFGLLSEKKLAKPAVDRMRPFYHGGRRLESTDVGVRFIVVSHLLLPFASIHDKILMFTAKFTEDLFLNISKMMVSATLFKFLLQFIFMLFYRKQPARN